MVASPSDLLTARARDFCGASDLDALGVFRIPAEALAGDGVDPDVAPALRAFLPRLSDGDALSRGERYYDVRSALDAWPGLLAACRRLAGAEEGDRLVRAALYENLFNVVAAMTFSYWERCCDEPEDLDGRGVALASLVAVLPDLARLHLGAALGRDLAGACPEIDWELLDSVGARFPRRWPLRTLREFDNKSRVLNEVLYLAQDVRAIWPFQAVLFPLYGALTLAAYFRAVECLRGGPSGEGQPPSVLIRLGFYDRGEASFRTAAGCLDLDRLLPRPWLDDAREALRGRRVLVVDDNAATGRTLRACREFILQCGGIPLTRSAETSWELLEEQQGECAPFDGVDLPGLRTNMSYALQCSLVALLLRGRGDDYARLAQRLDRTDFTAGLRENYRRARQGAALVPRQRWSVEREWAHARRHWREPGYPSPVPSSEPPSRRLVREDVVLPDGRSMSFYPFPVPGS